MLCGAALGARGCACTQMCTRGVGVCVCVFLFFAFFYLEIGRLGGLRYLRGQGGGVLSAVRGGLVNMQRTSKLNQTAKLSILGVT